MTITRLFVAASATLALALTVAMAAVDVRAAQAPKAASEGVYTKEQASRGLTVYDSSCASCHELSKFKGDEFAKTWTDKPATDLHTALVSMPMDAPGSLKPQEYADILAYFLSINGYPTGAAELEGSDAAIKALKIDAVKK